MSRARLAVGGTVAALAATVLLFGGTLGGEEAAPAQPLTTDARSLVSLGLEYQQRARETADASYLTRSETALRQALRLDPRDAAATEGLAALALTRHDFRGALASARRARRLAPDSARPLALLGDALVELGQYGAAFAAYDAFALRKPGLNAYARVAYGRELLGDRGGALEAMRLAVGAAPGWGEPTAWVRVELGKLYFGQGEVEAAGREYEAALAAFPGYVYALEGLAHVAAAAGRLDEAIALAREAAETAPLPQLVITLGDLFRSAGRTGDAAEQYELLAGIRRLLTGNGVRSELELALFDADRGVPAVREARRAHAERPSVQADDVLGWALVREGRCAEGLRYARRALRLGTRDALLFFHRGMAERCLGRDAAASRWFERALALNPHFSLQWAPVARRYAG